MEVHFEILIKFPLFWLCESKDEEYIPNFHWTPTFMPSWRVGFTTIWMLSPSILIREEKNSSTCCNGNHKIVWIRYFSLELRPWFRPSFNDEPTIIVVLFWIRVYGYKIPFFLGRFGRMRGNCTHNCIHLQVSLTIRLCFCSWRQSTTS